MAALDLAQDSTLLVFALLVLAVWLFAAS